MIRSPPSANDLLRTHNPLATTEPEGDDQPGIAPLGKEGLASQVPRALSTAGSRASGGESERKKRRRTSCTYLARVLWASRRGSRGPRASVGGAHASRVCLSFLTLVRAVPTPPALALCLPPFPSFLGLSSGARSLSFSLPPPSSSLTPLRPRARFPRAGQSPGSPPSGGGVQHSEAGGAP